MPSGEKARHSTIDWVRIRRRDPPDLTARPHVEERDIRGGVATLRGGDQPAIGRERDLRDLIARPQVVRADPGQGARGQGGFCSSAARSARGRSRHQGEQEQRPGPPQPDRRIATAYWNPASADSGPTPMGARRRRHELLLARNPSLRTDPVSARARTSQMMPEPRSNPVKSFVPSGEKCSRSGALVAGLQDEHLLAGMRGRTAGWRPGPRSTTRSPESGRRGRCTPWSHNRRADGSQWRSLPVSTSQTPIPIVLFGHQQAAVGAERHRQHRDPIPTSGVARTAGASRRTRRRSRPVRAS